MAFRNRALTTDYHHPSWEKDSFWTFAKYQTGQDEEDIALSVSKSEFIIDDEARKAARKAGKRYTPKINTETLQSIARSTVVHMSRGWSGAEFFVPEDWTLDDGKSPHPLRGKLAPCDAFWINSQEPEVLGDVEEFLDDLYHERLDDDDDRLFFRQPNRGVDGPTPIGRGAK